MAVSIYIAPTVCYVKHVIFHIMPFDPQNDPEGRCCYYSLSQQSFRDLSRVTKLVCIRSHVWTPCPGASWHPQGLL